MVRRTDPSVSLGAGHAPVEEVERRRGGCGFPFGTRVRGRSRKASHPKSLAKSRSSKAARLTHIKKGYYTPPRGPIFVPGLHWLAVILVGRDQQHDPPIWQACIGGPVVVLAPPSNAMNKASSCSRWRSNGEDGSCTSLIRASPAVSGSVCSLLSRCASCCAGRKSITWWMRRAIGGRPGKSRAASEGGKNGRCGTAVAISG